MKKIKFLLLVAVLAVPLMSVSPANPVDGGDQSQSSRTLIESHDLVNQSGFSPTEKRHYLAWLTSVASDSGVDGTHLRVWSDELFGLAVKTFKESPAGSWERWNSLAAEKNALVAISRIDPVSAMRRLTADVDKPVPAGDGTFPEDL